MLVSLSLAHLDSKKFNSNQEMIDFLTQNGFLNFEETSQVMGMLDRSVFLDSNYLAQNNELDTLYSLKAQKFSKEVDVTNPMMQALLLDCIHASIKGCELEEVNMLDVGTATGILTYGAALLNQNHYKMDKFSILGIDLASNAIKKAKSIENREIEIENAEISFMEDDFFNHFETMNNYNLVVSGCGMLHSDLIGSVYQKSENDSDLIVITPIFMTDSEQ
jgi:SAM-dependent methyltransferase